MTITVSKQDVHARWDELLSLAHGGTEVIVSGEGGYSVKLVPVVPEPPRREWKFNLHPGAWTVRDDFDDPIDEFSMDNASDSKAKRIPGLFAGQGWMSDDFDAPLPPEYLPSEE